MSATLLRDERGRRNESTYGFSRYTDDRGVYRLFGLPAGTYIVSAAAKTVGASMLALTLTTARPTILRQLGTPQPKSYCNGALRLRELTFGIAEKKASTISGAVIDHRQPSRSSPALVFYCFAPRTTHSKPRPWCSLETWNELLKSTV